MEPAQVQHVSLDRPKPRIFFNTIPKSGSVFVADALCELSGCQHLILGTGYFPNDTILIEEARKFSKGGFVAQQHADCRPNNIAILERYVEKWVVHFRDPRSVTLSWTHHLDALIKQNALYMLEYAAPFPGEEYLAQDFNDRLSWQIKHFLPEVVAWTSEWLGYCDSNRDRVLTTTYEDMVSDQMAFFERLLRFFEIDGATIGDPTRFRSEAAHFRKGEIAEWRAVFSERQQADALSAIPELLRQRMSWAV